MTAKPHERPEFYNALTYAVTVRITVEGGKRHGTADRRARKVAERLASTAARTPGVVEVTAAVGWTTTDGEVHWPERVQFAEANTGQGTHAEPDKLDRYLDPDHELAIRSLAQHNAAAEQRRQADRERRRTVGCRNTYAFSSTDRRSCECVYCEPDDHYQTLKQGERHGPGPFCTYRCVCGTPVAAEGERCLSHGGAEIVVLDGDAATLQLLAQRKQQRSAEQAQTHREPPESELEL